ncbi:Fungal transcriptional regulatory protein, N-terminal [Pleurostoma richardsiae]|uniref:Fungal transcriptional regulatory protein, N-terminal n=1 Tax=Pleurostoma richardsiae TaxID=41990 RepID=A0AA38R4T2_9PEZI|nr:Fungal transcriptional regulatory protein, N-terminal [Pleurostoma richardsiae]
MSTDPMSSTGSSPATGGEPDPKRRKIRKGTRSCWECKRRKIKCNYPSLSDTVCEGCRRRGTVCVSQEFPEETSAPSGSTRVVGDRLGKMEALVEQLVKRVGVPAGSGNPGDLAALASARIAGVSPREGREEDQSSNPGLPTPESLSAESARCLTAYDHASSGLESGLIDSSRDQFSAPSLAPEFGDACGMVAKAHNYEKLSRTLHAALPSQHDIDIIAETAERSLGQFYQMMWLPYSELFNGNDHTVDDLRKIPPPTAHPTIIGQKMLMLAILLQHVHPRYNPSINNLEEDWKTMRTRLVSLAVTYVTSRDELVGSLEGLICIMLEAIFQTNIGNLRRGWLTFRRALVVGQLMGLHRPSSPPIKKLDPSSRVDAKHIWFRIIYTDTYLALMLGLPLGYYDTSFASGPVMQVDTPMGRLERMHGVVAMKLLQRNNSVYMDCKEGWQTTHELDLEMQKVARSMPSRWWTVPQLGDIKDKANLFPDTLRLLNHFYHYNLLNQLHLPFMLRSSSDNKYDYSRVTCINAARELLVRFIAFRSVNLVAFCCRGVDFFAFIASLTLILAHLDAHRHGELGNYLAHQRLSDRGMMEQVADMFAELHSLNNDLVSFQSMRILKRLLAMETDAANGGNYSTSSEHHAVVNDCDVDESEGAVKLTIPYFGTIRIAKEGLTKTASSDPVHDTLVAVPAVPEPDALAPSASGSSATPGDQGAFQIADGTAPAASDWQTVPMSFMGLQSQEQGTPTLAAGGFYDNSASQQMYVPALTAGTEDWALQGVDMAFFDSLMRGQNTDGAALNAPVAWNTWGNGQI